MVMLRALTTGALCSMLALSVLAQPNASKPNDGSFETECRLLMKDKAFSRADCETVFKSKDPLETAQHIKCGDDKHLDYAYWTNTDDEGIVVKCVPEN